MGFLSAFFHPQRQTAFDLFEDPMSLFSGYFLPSDEDQSLQEVPSGMDSLTHGSTPLTLVSSAMSPPHDTIPQAKPKHFITWTSHFVSYSPDILYTKSMAYQGSLISRHLILWYILWDNTMAMFLLSLEVIQFLLYFWTNLHLLWSSPRPWPLLCASVDPMQQGSDESGTKWQFQWILQGAGLLWNLQQWVTSSPVFP